MSDIARDLAREGYVNETIDLTVDKPVPADCALVVVSGARHDFSRAELGRIEAYLHSGGRLLVLLSTPLESLSSVLASWGVRPGDSLRSDVKTISGTDVVVSDFADHVISAPLKGERLVLERPLSFAPSAAAEGGTGADRISFTGVASAGGVALAAVAERGEGAGNDLAIRPTRIVVVGDASFAMNGSLAARANANRDFFLNCIAFLSGTDSGGSSGKGGGYRLCRRPQDYTVGEIIELTEGTLAPIACLAADAGNCPRKDRCKTLPFWHEFDTMVHDFFYSRRLSDFLSSK
jgi:DNA-binding IscR family transcriptional regulator